VRRKSNCFKFYPQHKTFIMARLNIDFEIGVAEEALQPPPLSSIKAGASVCIRYAAAAAPSPSPVGTAETAQQDEQKMPDQAGVEPPPCAEPSGRVCLDASGQHLLGAVPESARKRLASFGDELQGSIRSIKRNEAGRPTQLLVRVQVVNGQPMRQGGALAV
jgi:hypothetical protein